VIALGGHPFALTMGLLFTAMGDESWRVRKDAVAVLTAAKPLGAEAIEGVIELLRASDNAGLRNSAVESLERLGADAVEALCAHLGDPDHDLRKFAIDILGSIGAPSCLPLVMRALDDPDSNVRVAAAENLGKLGDQRALPRLLQVLDGGDVWLKFTVLDALARIGSPVPLATLAPLLRESLLRRAVYDCLGSLGDAQCLPLLLEGVLERAKNAREAAVVALMRVRGRLAAESQACLVDAPLKSLKGSAGAGELIAALGCADPGALESLVQTIGIIGDERGALALLAVAHEEKFRWRCLEAFRGLGRLALPELFAHFPKATCAERAFIARLAGELGSSEGIELLLSGLSDDSHELRAACASSLGRLAPEGASPRVAALLEDAHPQVREAALEALQRLGVVDPAGVAGLCTELAVSHSPGKRRDAALLLCGLGDGERLSLLAKDEDASVRRAAVASLAWVRLPQTVGALSMALSDEEPEVRVAAAQALSEMGGPQVLEPLLLALNDPDPWVRTASLKGLSLLGDPAALPGVTALLSGARGQVLIAGLSTLAAVGGSAELAPVRAALCDGDEEVVEAAIGILSGFGGDWIEEHRAALIGHPHWAVRRSFVRAMVELLGAKALPHLREALAGESDPLVKDEIVGLMGRFI
jgi:HEAT repeat protein